MSLFMHLYLFAQHYSCYFVYLRALLCSLFCFAQLTNLFIVVPIRPWAEQSKGFEGRNFTIFSCELKLENLCCPQVPFNFQLWPEQGAEYGAEQGAEQTASLHKNISLHHVWYNCNTNFCNTVMVWIPNILDIWMVDLSFTILNYRDYKSLDYLRKNVYSCKTVEASVRHVTWLDEQFV